MDENKRKGNYGEKKVIKYLQEHGFPHAHKVKRGCGYDILTGNGMNDRKIEVKTSEKTYGTPQCCKNLFNNKKLKADFLYVVRISKNKRFKQIDIFSKEQVDRYSDKHSEITLIRMDKFDRDYKKGLFKPMKIIR